jgi:predicted PurR-regulated permease PerM
MPEEPNDSYLEIQRSRTLRILFLVLFLLVLVALFYIFRPYIWVFLAALTVYVGIVPVYDWLQERIKNQGITITLLTLMVFLLIMVPGTLIIIFLGDQTYHVYVFVLDQIENGALQKLQQNEILLKALAAMNISINDLTVRIGELVQETVGDIFANITSLLAYPLAFVVNIFFMVLMLALLMKEGPQLEEKFYRVLPFPVDIERRIVKRLKDVIKILLAGNLLIMTLQGTFLGIGLYIAGFSTPLLWAIIGSIFSLIPVIGTSFVWIPAAVFLIIQGSFGWAFFIVLWGLGWYLFFENIVKPWAFGEKLNFHPMLFFFLLLGSIQAFGLPGVIIGPILLTFFFSLWEVYSIINQIHLSEQASGKDE